MKKMLLIPVVLLLTLTLPTVFAKENPKYYNTTVRFAGDIVGEQTGVKTWPEPPSSKIVIEWEPITLTFQDRGDAREASDRYKDTHNWNSFEGMKDCWLYLRVFIHKGQARAIECYFGGTPGKWDFMLKGSGIWSYVSETKSTITCDGEFTIYELRWTGGQEWKMRTRKCWTGTLSFTIEIEVEE